jgi:hypothetical protein
MRAVTDDPGRNRPRPAQTRWSMKLGFSALALLAAVCLMGCARSHDNHASALAPGPTGRMVPGERQGEPANSTAPPPPEAAAPADVALADLVSRLLKGDATLAASSENVIVLVEKGSVTLRGSVPSDAAAEEIVQRISRLPGVTGVSSQLKVDIR